MSKLLAYVVVGIDTDGGLNSFATYQVKDKESADARAKALDAMWAKYGIKHFVARLMRD